MPPSRGQHVWVPLPLPDRMPYTHILEHLTAVFLIVQNAVQLRAYLLYRHGICNQLFHHLPVGYEIDQGNVLHFQYMPFQESDNLPYRSMVTYRLRHTKQSCFQRCRPRSDQCSLCLPQQRECLVEDNLHVHPTHITFVILGGNTRSTGQHQLIIGKEAAARSMSGRLSLISCLRLPASRAITGLAESPFARTKSSNVSELEARKAVTSSTVGLPT